MKNWGVPVVLVIAGSVLVGCDQVNSAVDTANSAASKASTCTEALGLADLNPLADPAKLKAQAADKEKRLRDLASQVQDKDVKNALVTMAGSYVEVQKERFDDASVVAKWAQRNVQRLDVLRKACF
ncbi:MAG: hypothetical protein JWQ81_4384 [Amycolatopsis sp.]|jgi:hypothetical protein|uniref:hypothetical protein n=1 Tax=Amycolatopsis sp. TaxID=37632 RepID=UPI00260B2B63|nr:hypothetical protein [Amycolatopsis sp.]MCU1683645.1 hypothetical protein [Amycolatopsis sp.]